MVFFSMRSKPCHLHRYNHFPPMRPIPHIQDKSGKGRNEVTENIVCAIVYVLCGIFLCSAALEELPKCEQIAVLSIAAVCVVVALYYAYSAVQAAYPSSKFDVKEIQLPPIQDKSGKKLNEVAKNIAGVVVCVACGILFYSAALEEELSKCEQIIGLLYAAVFVVAALYFAYSAVQAAYPSSKFDVKEIQPMVSAQKQSV